MTAREEKVRILREAADALPQPKYGMFQQMGWIADRLVEQRSRTSKLLETTHEQDKWMADADGKIAASNRKIVELERTAELKCSQVGSLEIENARLRGLGSEKEPELRKALKGANALIVELRATIGELRRDLELQCGHIDRLEAEKRDAPFIVVTNYATQPAMLALTRRVASLEELL